MGIKEIVLPKLMFLADFKKIKISRIQIKRIIFYFPGNSELIPFIKPVYEEVDGWEKDISNISNYQNLPEKAKEYIRKIEQVTESTISIISVGPKRTQTIFR